MKDSLQTNPGEGYVLNIVNLKNGDVILESGKKIHSEIIKKKTGSNYSHAMIFLDGTIFESTKGGTVFTRVPNRFYVKAENDLKVIRYKDDINNHSLEQITFHARTNIATSYSVPEAVRSSRKNKPTNKKEKGQFCSRFVAESLNAGGIRTVKNIHYCTPADLENSELFFEVPFAVKIATPDEIEHASSGEMHPKHQKATVEWTKKAKKALKAFNSNAQTVSEIYQAVLDSNNLKLDKLVATAMIESGYTDNYNDDKDANPYRYSISEFTKLLTEKRVNIDEEVRKELSIFNLQINNIKISRTNLENSQGIFRIMKLDYEVCLGILRSIKARMDVLLEVCRENDIVSPSVDRARHMCNAISSELEYTKKIN